MCMKVPGGVLPGPATVAMPAHHFLCLWCVLRREWGVTVVPGGRPCAQPGTPQARGIGGRRSPRPQALWAHVCSAQGQKGIQEGAVPMIRGHGWVCPSLYPGQP
eukprot:CAMPEP_0174305290 /NCGR_PEP_ID=MMETSP0809-20121228/61321_1 /TAXON_ID=73025 ORGANISM="Eutreptiella gymnastica-like, Strain CCMP1594" /NCGR_SAMPLE_ID=MMETSP0809 /ASSEMBLY_ACC=CAM_ASM_000658 /LENGTH=103 /DNA_ID=CAMNT_0015411737 /DNA_START=1424 /DNA_END=1735 /DNA_ORIENTATION=-